MTSVKPNGDDDLHDVIELPAQRSELLGLSSADQIVETERGPFLRSLPALKDSESRSKRWTFLVIALAITAGYWFFLMSFYVPAIGRPGIDENAYLLGGRNIAEHLTTGFKPANDFEFVGAMWVRTSSGWYYPKYPAGISLLDAIPIIFGGARHGVEWAFLVSPICMTLAVLGMFFLARLIVDSFYALLAMIVLGTGITSLQFALIPGSHVAALCMVVWGMFFLFRWWQNG